MPGCSLEARYCFMTSGGAPPTVAMGSRLPGTWRGCRVLDHRRSAFYAS